MNFWDNVADILPRDDEVITFETYESGYYALLRRGERLDIIKTLTFQPAIISSDCYSSHIFLEALQGFFLLRQQVIDGAFQHWEVCAEFVPHQPHSFFSEAEAHYWKVRNALDHQACNQ